MIEWKKIDSAPRHAFKADSWYRRGERRLLSDSVGGQPYFGYWSYTKTGKGRWWSDVGHACFPLFWSEEPTPPEA